MLQEPGHLNTTGIEWTDMWRTSLNYSDVGKDILGQGRYEGISVIWELD